MFFTTVRIERPEGTILQRNVAALIEQASPDDTERLDLAGARPYDAFWIYTLQGVPSVPIQRRDILFDESNADPDTGQPAKYRVAGLVETFDADHQEALCQRIVGG